MVDPRAEGLGWSTQGWGSEMVDSGLGILDGRPRARGPRWLTPGLRVSTNPLNRPLADSLSKDLQYWQSTCTAGSVPLIRKMQAILCQISTGLAQTRTLSLLLRPSKLIRNV
jgi:hypothetical protein